jgi:hypothetical protein
MKIKNCVPGGAGTCLNEALIDDLQAERDEARAECAALREQVRIATEDEQADPANCFTRTDLDFTLLYDTLVTPDDVEIYDDGNMTIEATNVIGETTDIYTTLDALYTLVKRARAWIKARAALAAVGDDGGGGRELPVV